MKRVVLTLVTKNYTDGLRIYCWYFVDTVKHEGIPDEF